MRKLLMVGLLFTAGLAVASNMGPYGFDEKGAQISTGVGFYTASSTTLYGVSPAYAGQMVMCNTCNNGQSTPGSGAAGSYNLCIASGTGAGAWVVASSNTLQCK